jgi:hypothetical protein
MAKTFHDPIVVQDSIRLHCSAWVVGDTSTNPADAEIEAVMEVLCPSLGS